jgi:oligoendopeptidase F
MSTTSEFAITWELDSLAPHPESEGFRSLLNAYAQDLRQLAADSEQLPAVGAADAAAAWASLVERYADVHGRTEDLHSFVGCHAAADAGNRHFQHLEGELSALSPLRQQVLTNLELQAAGAEEEEFASFVAASEPLRRNEFFLQECRRNGAFRLAKPEELLANALDVDGRHAWGRLYDRLSSELRVEVMEQGELVRKSPGQVSWDSAERTVRQNNFLASQKAWATIADSCADALNHIAGSRLTRYERLGVQDHLDLPLRLNRMGRQTLETMWSTISERKPVLTKYLARKAELLGLERLTWYDVTAPLDLSRRPAQKLAWDEACRTVVQTFDEFSAELGDFARQAFAERWIEAEDRSGKRQGGFCTGFPGKRQSRIFMTFTESADSMSTLAHELGHAYHSHVLRDQPVLLQDYPMNLAETASTFAEAVLQDRQLVDAPDDAAQLKLLDQMLGDAVAFLMNIHCRFLFEDRFHRERSGGELSAQRLTELMLNAQREAYCEALADDGWYGGFWISKLHFYISGWPFYNFPYTFGYLLSLGVYRLRDQVDDFPRKVRDFLIATGCQQAEDAVEFAFGEDLRQPAFWNGSLDIVQQRVEQFLELADRVY